MYKRYQGAEAGPLTKPGFGFRIKSDRTPDRIKLVSSLLVQNSFFEKICLTMTQVAQIFSSDLPVTDKKKKKNHFSCIIRLKIHHQLENHRKELFSTEVHWEIFCCIT